MSLSAKVEYACIAMLDLAVMDGIGRPVQQRRMAERHDIPAQFLVQILQQLRAAGLVTSTRGASGGYQLARPSEDITLWDVVTAVQGDVERFPFENRESSVASVLRKVWTEVIQAQNAVLQETSLACLLTRVDVSEEPMYYI
ncbi:MAG TPA: Rrf2 family transcriptional regulator [Pirellulaceae bacterium]